MENRSSDNIVRPFAFFRAGNRAQSAMAGKSVLMLENIYKYFHDDQPTLRGANLMIHRGEFVFVTGPSGSGKSTLLKLIYRELEPEEGHVYFCGREIGRLSQREIPFLRRNLGIVFQDFRLIEHWNVYDNVAIALEIRALSPRIIRRRVEEALERVGLAGRTEERAETLSGGEKQRVAIARAIVSEPTLILADEPTGNLDPHLAIDMLTLLEEINAQGTSVLFATHDHSLISKRNHRLVSIESGQIIEHETRIQQTTATRRGTLAG